MRTSFEQNKPFWWMRTVLAAALFMTLLAPAVQAAPAAGQTAKQGKPLTSANVSAFLKQFFASEQAKPNYVGATVVVVKDGQTVFQSGYGFADKAKKTAVDPNETVFRIASISKTFTAAAVMQLVEQGKVNLQEDFRTYTGPLEFDNPFAEPVTVGQLLTHTTGFRIQDPKQEDIHNDLTKVVSIEDYARNNMPPVVREPGGSYMYDNFAYLLLGLIVEKVSGEPFDDYMQQHIFAPLGMDKSGFKLEGELKSDLATAYDAADKPIDLYAVTPTVMPQGGMLTTADDMARFMNAFLNGGTLGDSRVLAESTVAEMQQYRSSIHALLPDTTYGFEAASQLPGAGSSTSIIGKAGDLIGFSSYMFLIPEQKTGVFISYNKQGILRELFYPAFIAEFFPQYASPAANWMPNPAPGDNLKAYEGYYADLRLKSLVSSVTYSAKDGLMISDAILGPRKLIQVDKGLFSDQITGKYTAFKLGEDGRMYLKEPYLNPLGYEQRGVEPKGFADVTPKHPYAKPILMLQSLGYYENDPAKKFLPKSGITRAKYVRLMLESSGVAGSEQMSKPAFSDIAGHPDAAYVQRAAEIGMIKGTKSGKFKPNEVITRQEAAVMIWRLLAPQYPAELFKNVKLAGNTDEWAVPAVKMMVAFGLHGPQAVKDAKGAVDFRSRQPLSNQETAAILYALFTQPVDQIAAQLMQAQK